MKKSIAVALLLVLVLSAIYLFISPYKNFRHSVRVIAAAPAVKRTLLDQENWKHWWPGERISKYEFAAGGIRFRITDKQLGSLNILVNDGKDSMQSVLTLVSAGTDSVDLVWTGRGPATNNPLERISRLFSGSVVETQTGAILDSLTHFATNPSRLYGFDIKNQQVTDTAFVSTYEVITGAAGTEMVYRLVDELRNYIRVNSAVETGYPMLNISPVGDSNLVRVAIPVDRRLPETKRISYKWMPAFGFIAVGEFRGGPDGANLAVTTMETYLKDHDLKQPAIPYQSLVTDRRLEPDTSRWITKIYCPHY